MTSSTRPFSVSSRRPTFSATICRMNPEDLPQNCVSLGASSGPEAKLRLAA
jgi:hypothetical protein